MTTLERYYEDPGSGQSQPGLEWSPLRHDDALQECMAVDFRCNVVDSIVGIIVDRRTGLADVGGNTGLVVLEGVSRLSWTGVSRIGKPSSRSIMSHVMGLEGGCYTLKVYLQKAHLEIDFGRGSYYEGDVLGLDQAQPDLTESRSPYPENAFQCWGSEFHVEGWDSIGFA